MNKLSFVIDQVIRIQKIKQELTYAQCQLVGDLMELHAEVGTHKLWDYIAALQIPAEVRGSVFKQTRELDTAKQLADPYPDQAA